jgi:hypothetical protein
MDTETITKKEKSDNDDFPSIGMDIFNKINFKIAILLFIVGGIIFSDIFIENMLPKNLVDVGTPNSKGTLIQLLLLSFAYIVIDLLVRGKVL